MSIGKKRLLVYAVMCLSLLMVANLIKDIIRLGKADERLVAAKAELEMARQEQEQLTRSLKTASDGFWLEKQIRNVLKMAKPDEVVVVVPEEIAMATSLRQDLAGQAGEKSNFNLWFEVFGF